MSLQEHLRSVEAVVAIVIVIGRCFTVLTEVKLLKTHVRLTIVLNTINTGLSVGGTNEQKSMSALQPHSPLRSQGP